MYRFSVIDAIVFLHQRLGLGSLKTKLLTFVVGEDSSACTRFTDVVEKCLSELWLICCRTGFNRVLSLWDTERELLQRNTRLVQFDNDIAFRRFPVISNFLFVMLLGLQIFIIVWFPVAVPLKRSRFWLSSAPHLTTPEGEGVVSLNWAALKLIWGLAMESLKLK